MPIDAQAHVAPPTAVRTVELALRERAAGATFATPRLRQAQIGVLAHSMPHRVVSLSLARVKGGGTLREMAEDVAWRFLIHEGDQVIAAARAVPGEAGGYDLGELSEGEFAAGTERAIVFAESLPQVQAGRFEAILTIVPEAYVVALWLRDLAGTSDLVLPIPGIAASDHQWHPDQVMKADAFVEKLRDLARRGRGRGR